MASLLTLDSATFVIPKTIKIMKIINTQIIKIDKNEIDQEKIKAKIKVASKALKEGGLVAFPTETVYGLGANALNARAIQKIFEAKGRPSDNPLIVHISKKEDLLKLVKEVPQIAEKLMQKFWPGPLTLIFEKSDIVPDIVTGGLNTVAIRMPNSAIALALIEQASVPIAAPSSNLSGKPSPTLAAHVVHDLDGRVDVIVDGGETNIGLESTVLNLTSTPLELLRPGAIGIEALETIAGKIVVPPSNTGEKSEQIAVKSPGMKYRHYAPKAKVILIVGKEKKIKSKIEELLLSYKNQNKQVALMLKNNAYDYKADMLRIMGNDYNYIAKNLFAQFREFDHTNIDIIIVEGLEEKDLGLAIMNRLKKAAYETIEL